MIKRIISGLLSLCLVFTLAPSLKAVETPPSEKDTAISFSNGTGTESDPFQITTAQQLNEVRNNLSAHFVLTKDIDLSVFSSEGWTPIGTKEEPFTGTLDGAGHTIRNLHLLEGGDTAPAEGALDGSKTWIGLFGYAINASIQNVNLEIASCNAKGASRIYLGGLVGYDISSYINNVWVSGADLIASPGTGYWAYHNSVVGGIVGYADGTQIIDAHNYCNLFSKGSLYTFYAGGITGYGGIIVCASNSGNITSQGSSCDGYIGGISGYNADISECYNTGSLSIPSGSSYHDRNAGGIAGYGGTVENCYNLGDISSLDVAVGIASENTDINNCYSAGKINNETLYYISSVGEASAHEMEIQSSYSGFDFETTWMMPSNTSYSYPILRNNTQITGDGDNSEVEPPPTEEDGNDTTIPADAVEYNGHFYKVYDYSISWKDANTACVEMGGYLATLTSADEEKFVYDLLKNGTKNYYWLGGSDEKQEGVWEWITGEDWNYTHWFSGQPDNHSDHTGEPENYLVIARANMGWNDLPNTGDTYGSSELKNSGYICEWEAKDNSDYEESKRTGFAFSANTPTNCITVGSTFGLYIGYYVDGQLDSTVRDYSIVVSNSNIIDIAPGAWNDEYGQYYVVTAKDDGYSTITATNPQNGDAEALGLYVVATEAGYTFGGVPKMMIEEDKTTNFYNYSGLVVDEFKAEPIKNTSGEIDHYLVTMNVYNTKAIYAAVTVYDSSGRIERVQIIEKMDILPDDFVGTVNNLINSTGDLFHLLGNSKFYSGESISKKTKIEIKVPVGGHLTISNNMSASPAVLLANLIGIFVELELTAADIAFNSIDIASVKTSVIDKSINDIITSSVESVLTKPAIDTIWENASNELQTIDLNYNNFGEYLQKFLLRLLESNIDLISIMHNNLTSLPGLASIGESVIKDIVPTGRIIDLLYGWAAVQECKASIYILLKSYSFPKGIHIYAPEMNSVYASNGIKVEPPVIEDEIAIHAYQVFNTASLGLSLPNEQISPKSEYETYSITMYKNGEEVQPNAAVKVMIPLSSKFKSANPESIKVFRHNEDGTLTDMQAEVIDGYAIFVTDHFSYYSIVAETGISVSNISLNAYNLQMNFPNATEKLIAIIIPDNSTNKTIVWHSDNPGVATVNSDGVVTAVSNGIAVITATTEDGGYTAACTVSVSISSMSDDENSGDNSEINYSISISTKDENGSITIRPTRAQRGETVTITAIPDPGYEVGEIIVTDRNGREITVRSEGGNRYTFTMPSSQAKVSATFMQIEESTPQIIFRDVTAGTYYYDAVLWAVEFGITTGVTATTFNPNGVCTRAQIVTFLWRANGSPAPQTGVNPFTDVSPDAYYYDAVLWAVEEGITSGTTATSFSPNSGCTRAQAATFLWRSEGFPAASGSSFNDVADDAYYADAVDWAVANGVTLGTTASTFSPNSGCTRAQIVTFLYRAMA